jgi:hypothetical protein
VEVGKSAAPRSKKPTQAPSIFSDPLEYLMGSFNAGRVHRWDKEFRKLVLLERVATRQAPPEAPGGGVAQPAAAAAVAGAQAAGAARPRAQAAGGRPRGQPGRREQDGDSEDEEDEDEGRRRTMRKRKRMMMMMVVACRSWETSSAR